MAAETTKAHPELSLPKDYKKDYQCEVVFKGDIPPYDQHKVDVNLLAWSVVFELIDNCVENRIPNSKKAAKQIQVTFEPGKVTVEDDFVYEDPQKVLDNIVAIRDSGKPKTTKPIEEDLVSPFGGVGIFESVQSLGDYGGELNYYKKGGTIVAVATWKPD